MIVWLASYPRSGNTFFRVILNNVFDIKTYSIYDDRGDIGADEQTSEVVGHEFLPQDFDLQKAREEKKVYYIKTHELLDNRVHEDDKVIYLIRDGREATLSFTKHQNTFSKQNKKIIDTIYGNTRFFSWGKHVESWNPKNRENTLLVKFEELIEEPSKYIKVLSAFLNVNPIGNKIPSFEELKKINPKFFRSGKTNSWEKEYLEDEHLSFWLKNVKIMDQYGYIYKKPEIFNKLSQTDLLICESIKQNNYLIDLAIEKKQIIEQKNRELQSKEQIIEQKNRELEKEKNVLLHITKKEEKLEKSIEYLCQSSTIINPFKKINAYKKMLETYHNIKEGNI